jgi:hypothetical protein
MKDDMNEERTKTDAELLAELEAIGRGDRDFEKQPITADEERAIGEDFLEKAFGPSRLGATNAKDALSMKRQAEAIATANLLKADHPPDGRAPKHEPTRAEGLRERDETDRPDEGTRTVLRCRSSDGMAREGTAGDAHRPEVIARGHAPQDRRRGAPRARQAPVTCDGCGAAMVRGIRCHSDPRLRCYRCPNCGNVASEDEESRPPTRTPSLDDDGAGGRCSLA